MRYSYQAEQWLLYPIETLFAFFADPSNLPRLMPPWQKAHIDEAAIVPPRTNGSGVGSGNAAGAGSRITLSFRPFPYSPIRVRWVAEIAEFVWNDHFCDRQIRGPFAYWNHCHSLRAATEGGIDRTLITDHVEYELPFGPAGRLAHRLFLRKQIQQTFAYRQSQLVKILGEMTSKAA
jgi:ligand-binding SRPBCC domain-containing protein